MLVLANGSVFRGRSIGAEGQAVGEVVFNTAMTGYQEMLTDPSYAGQMITLTYPHIGNVGVNLEDAESARIWATGLIVRDLPVLHSNWRAKAALPDYLKHFDVVAIADIDTRRLTRILREEGAQSGCIMAGDNIDEQTALKLARSFPSLAGVDLAQHVSTRETYTWTEGSWGQPSAPKPRFHVVAYDFGVKRNILRLLADRGCRITVVPATTPATEVLAMRPDGVFLSNGPGDPAACAYAITAIDTLLAANMPLFGICLGYQLLALACGAKTMKMKFGHHGANHPVQDLVTGHVFISSQNHGFAVEEASLPQKLRPTHRSLFDATLQGIEHVEKPAFGFQGHPEASPGPHDVVGLFDRFIDVMSKQSHRVAESIT